MMKKWILGVCSFAALSALCHSQPTIINDRKITINLERKLGELVDKKRTVSGEELAKQLARKSCKLSLPNKAPLAKEDVYANSLKSVALVSSVFNCGKCDKWHLRSSATAWVLSEDGILVTNYHVFKKSDVPCFGVSFMDGTVAPVVEILAADEQADIAIFRIEGKGYHPLILGEDAKVGSDVHITAHPDGNFFTYSSGHVTRYSMGRGKQLTPWMSVSAEFAKGSSGGPVMNDNGEVVGMVANTQWVYYKFDPKTKKRDDLQMVIKNCVPIFAIKKLIEP